MTDKEKSIPVLEKEKLEIEIKLLKQNLEKEKKEGLGTKNFGEIIRKNIALILAVISVLGGVFGIILPVNQYFEEKKKEMIPILNKEIISLVGKLNSNSETTRQEATVMLNYYGLDAIPVLLLRLERSMNETEVLRLILAIKNIHDHNDPGVLDEILYSFKVEFEKNYTIANSSEISYHKINNYKDRSHMYRVVNIRQAIFYQTIDKLHIA